MHSYMSFSDKGHMFFKMYQEPLKSLRLKAGVVLICINSWGEAFRWNYFTLMSLRTQSQEQ